MIFRGKWTNPNNGNSVVGHQTSDGYEGTYTNSELGNLELDGFFRNKSGTITLGTATLGEKVGTYYISLDGKLILTIEMIAGRLELFPILLLFAPNTWRKRI